MRRKHKTTKMLLIEAKDPRQRDIEQIMLEALAEHGTQRRAAPQIGITHAAFNLWFHRLGLHEKISEEN